MMHVEWMINSLVPGKSDLFCKDSFHCTWNIIIDHKATLVEINSLAPRRFERNFGKVIFKLILMIDGCWSYFLWNCPQKNVRGPYVYKVNTGSGNGLVLSDHNALYANLFLPSLLWLWVITFCLYSETPHEQPPHEQPPLLWGHIFRHHYIFLTSHLNVNPWWTATPLTWSEASDFGSSHPWPAATQQLLEVASHGIHGWFGCGLTDIHVNHTSGQPWVHRPKACKGVDHT